MRGSTLSGAASRALDSLTSVGGLRYFHLGSSTSLESIDPLATCDNLKSLGLENIKRISDLDPIGDLRGLEELAVEGSTWTTQYVETLRLIGRLLELRYLSLINLRAGDGTLRPLYTLRKLRRFRAAAWWDEAELQELRKLNQGLVE